MILITSVISIIAYILALFVFRKKWVQQQMAFLAVFLAGTAVIGELDILLPIYFVASFLPFLLRMRRITTFTGLLSVYLLIYLIIGLVWQNPTRTIVTFIAKTWQFLVFFIVYDEKITLDEDDYKRTIWMVMIIETVLGVYLFFTSTMVDGLNGLVRLVNNGQPITGNISTFALPISVYFYFKNRANPKNTRFLLISNLYMLIWIVLSGTRGYTMEFAATMFLVFYDYFTNREVGKATQRNRIIAIFGIVAAVFVALVVIPGVFERLSLILRLKSSAGIRTYENAAVQDYLKTAPLHEVIFGIGLGGKAADHFAMRDALYKQFSLGMWSQRYYLSESGTLFHNLYANITLCLGLLGIAITIAIGMQIWKRITSSCGEHTRIRKIMHLFLLSFFLMNYYRWSTECGIGQMIVFALILKHIEQDNMLKGQT